MNFFQRRRSWVLLVSTAIATGVLLALLFATLRNLPAIEALQDYQPKGITRLLDHHHKLLAEIFHERRLPVRLEQIPLKMRQAVIAIEDSGFFEHHGISARGTLRAFLKNILRGRVSQGGSTLTQQLAKVLFLTPERSLERKFKEWMLALQIERTFSKEEILELYLNQIYLGEGNYGVTAAANFYFCKTLEQLTTAEIAVLAAIPKGPAIFAPTKNTTRSLERRNLVLKAMQRQNFISENELQSALKEETHLNLCPSPGIATHWTAAVIQELESRVGENQLLKGQLDVETTLDGELQGAAENAVRLAMTDYDKRHKPRPNDPGAEAAFVAVDPASGELRALVGGRDFRKSQFNRVLQARRQTGSAFKPIVFATAIKNGMTQATIVQDLPGTFTGVNGTPYNPDNYTKKFLGPVTLRNALEQSLNSVALRLTAQFGLAAVQQTARQLGITSPLPDNLTIALGSGTVSLLELTAAYAPIFSGGTFSSPHLVNRVTDANGEQLFAAEVSTTNALPADVAWIMRDMLRGVVLNGTAQSLKEIPCFPAGKTGTSNDYRDALFIGFLQDSQGGVVAGAWVGRDDNRGMGQGETGAMAALPMWKYFAQAVCKEGTAPSVHAPADIINVRIDHSSGKLATDRCDDAIDASFIHGTEPTEVCSEEL